MRAQRDLEAASPLLHGALLAYPGLLLQCCFLRIPDKGYPRWEQGRVTGAPTGDLVAFKAPPLICIKATLHTATPPRGRNQNQREGKEPLGGCSQKIGSVVPSLPLRLLPPWGLWGVGR